MYIGSFESILPQLPSEIHTEGSDVRHICVDRFTIDDARSLTKEASQQPFEGNVRSFVLSFLHAPTEAQNALLKTLEDPAPTSRFYVVVPRREVLIPTVQSRLMHVETALEKVPVHATAKFFLQASYKDRLKLVADKTKEGDTVWIEELLLGLESFVEKQKDVEGMRALIFVRSYISYPGASKKMLLEYLALTICQ